MANEPSFVFRKGIGFVLLFLGGVILIVELQQFWDGSFQRNTYGVSPGALAGAIVGIVLITLLGLALVIKGYTMMTRKPGKSL